MADDGDHICPKCRKGEIIFERARDVHIGKFTIDVYIWYCPECGYIQDITEG